MGAAETFIAEDTIVSGTVAGCRDHVVVAGRVTGGVRSVRVVTVEESGVVSSGVDAGRLHVVGTIEGNVSVTGAMTVSAAGTVQGPVQCGSLDAAKGAELRGVVSCLRSDVVVLPEELEAAANQDVVTPSHDSVRAQASTITGRESLRRSSRSPEVGTRREVVADHCGAQDAIAALPRWAWSGGNTIALVPNDLGSIVHGIKSWLGAFVRTHADQHMHLAVALPTAWIVLSTVSWAGTPTPMEIWSEVDEDVVFSMAHYVVPDEHRLPVVDAADLDEIVWYADDNGSLRHHALRWGIAYDDLAALNPNWAGDDDVPVGTPLRVHAVEDWSPGVAVGAPNRGSLVDGVPMPEGPHWELRTFRQRVYGTSTTIRSLVGVFHEYGRRFPGAPAVRIGDLSAKRGHYLPPHRSHQTGRDVDVFYVRTDGRTRGMITRDSFDAPKNWFLIRRLIDTGQVQQIFMAHRLRRLIEEQARRELPAERVAEYLAVISGDRDHKGHMHIRFRCASDNARCRAHSVVEGPAARQARLLPDEPAEEVEPLTFVEPPAAAAIVHPRDVR